MNTADFVICGAGILGLCLARELVARGHSNILIFDKEPAPGKHASGRNSGVLHAGIYYDPGTLKARMCFEGNRRMRTYCQERSLPLLETGKVVVTRHESEIETLLELERRATKNGAQVEVIDEQSLLELEPEAKTVGKALFSPLTAVVDPKAIILALHNELEEAGVRFLFNTQFLAGGRGSVHTSQGTIQHGMFINAAGAHSDKVAHAFGIGRNYRLIPFKGIYKVLKEAAARKIRGSIYPVPNIKNPFLGIHFTRSVHGEVYLGPTAIPAFGRENYGIVKGMDKEFAAILFRDAVMFLNNKKFRAVALEEPRKYFFTHFFNDAKSLVHNLDPKEIKKSLKVGIRPQLVDLQSHELVMDFLIEQGPQSMHILNSISPAFTSAMSFAELGVDTVLSAQTTV